MGGATSQEAQDVHAKPLFRVSISRPSRTPLTVQIDADPAMPPCLGSYGNVLCPQPKSFCQMPQHFNCDIRDGDAGGCQFEGCHVAAGAAGPLVHVTKAGSTLLGKRARRKKEKGQRRRQEPNPGELKSGFQEPAAILVTLSQFPPEKSSFRGSETKTDPFVNPTNIVTDLRADVMSKHVTEEKHLSSGELSYAELQTVDLYKNSSSNRVKSEGDLLDASTKSRFGFQESPPVQSLEPRGKVDTNVPKKLADTRPRTMKKAVPHRRWDTNGKESRNGTCWCSGHLRCDCSHPKRMAKSMNVQKMNLDKVGASEVLNESHERSFAVHNKLQEELSTRTVSQVTSNGSTVTVQVEHVDPKEKKISRIHVNKSECRLDIMSLISSDRSHRRFLRSMGSWNDACAASPFASEEQIRSKNVVSLIGNCSHKNVSTNNCAEQEAGRSQTQSMRNDSRQDLDINACIPSSCKKRRSSLGHFKKSNKEDMGSRTQETKFRNEVEIIHNENSNSHLAIVVAEKKLGCEDSQNERMLAAPAERSLPLFRYKQWCDGHPFQEGEDVEVRSFKTGYRGAWFRCRVEKCRFYVLDDFSPMLPQYLVQYIDYPDEKPEWINVYDRDKRKDCDPRFQLMMRPIPPHQMSVTTLKSEVVLTATETELELAVLQKEKWEEGDKVDWACDGCWWLATVCHTAEDHVLLRLLQFPEGEGNGELEKALFKDLRATLLWDKGVWSFPRPPQEPSRQGVAGGQLVYLPKSVGGSRYSPGQHFSSFEGMLLPNSSSSSEINMTSSNTTANIIPAPETPYSIDISPLTDSAGLCNQGPPSQLGFLSTESAQSEQYCTYSSEKEHHNTLTPLSICPASGLKILSTNATSSGVLERMSSVQSENTAEHPKTSALFQMQNNCQAFLCTSPLSFTPDVTPSWTVPRKPRSRRTYRTISTLGTKGGLSSARLNRL